MSKDSNKAREISLGDDFGDVVVKANRAQVEISADGSFCGLPSPRVPRIDAEWSAEARAMQSRNNLYSPRYDTEWYYRHPLEPFC